MAQYTPDNRTEVANETPAAWPLGRFPGEAESLDAQIRRIIATQVSQLAQQHDHETLEEANDFEIEEDDFLNLPTVYQQMAEDRPPGYLPDAPESVQRRQEEPPGTPLAKSSADASESILEAPRVEQPSPPKT